MQQKINKQYVGNFRDHLFVSSTAVQSMVPVEPAACNRQLSLT